LVSTHIGGWEIITLSGNNNKIAKITSTIKEFFPNVIVGDILNNLINILKEKNQTLTVAESCTGGRVASLITSVAGSSSVFNGSMVTYSNEIKHVWLGVNKASLKAFGAVSSEVVKEMAIGILETAGAHHSVAISGIAGPSGGSKEKPVGTVYIAYANYEGKVVSQRLFLKGDRENIQISAAYHAIRLFITNIGFGKK
jgi:nicotinamide-nucleotide amidase